MRLNVDNYRAVLEKKQLSHEQVRKSTGLSERSYSFILDQGFIENETLERIADSVGCLVSEICRPDYEGSTENVIEWIRDSPRATLTLCQRRTITRVKRLAEKFPEDVQILAENKDGSIFAHVPVGWVKISPIPQRSEAQREAARRNFLKVPSLREKSK